VTPGGETAGQGLSASSFVTTLSRVEAYVRSEPGAWGAFAQHARDDPEGTTRALLALGTVLLDIAASAYDLTPAEMLGKVSRTVDLHRLEQSRLADSR
jgi:hypothetical protein